MQFLIKFFTNILDYAYVANNLPKMSRRMKSFFEYWTPSWKKFIDTMPERLELMKQIINHDCYVYVLMV